MFHVRVHVSLSVFLSALLHRISSNWPYPCVRVVCSSRDVHDSRQYCFALSRYPCYMCACVDVVCVCSMWSMCQSNTALMSVLRALRIPLLVLVVVRPIRIIMVLYRSITHPYNNNKKTTVHPC